MTDWCRRASIHPAGHRGGGRAQPAGAPCSQPQRLPPLLLTPRRRLELKPLDNRIWLHPDHAAEPTELSTEDVLADAAAHPGVLGMLSWRQTGICSYPTLILSRHLVSDDDDDDEA